MERPVVVLQLNPVAKKVIELLEPHIERLGFELVAADFRKGTRNSLLRLLLDKPGGGITLPGGGITLNDLERLSPVLGDLLDVYDPIEGRYTLEVASPGINRPLVKLKDFEAYRGQQVKIRTLHPRGGRRLFQGTLTAVDPHGVELADAQSGENYTFNFNEIQVANYEHKFD